MSLNIKTYQLAYFLAKGISATKKLQLLTRTFKEESRHQLVKELIHYKLNGYVLANLDSVLNAQNLTQDEIACLEHAESLLVECALQVEKYSQGGIEFVAITDPEYPQALKKYLKNNAPYLLFYKGNLSLLQLDAIAILGSRGATDEGLAFAQLQASEAVKRQQVVVSGNAKGIDYTAVEAALNIGGSAINVLAEGLGKTPKGFKQNYKHFLEGRLLYISQFAPALPWSSANAMIRNGTVYGLASSIYIADMEDSGGTWEGVIKAIKDNQAGKIFIRGGIKAASALQGSGVNILPETNGTSKELALVESKPKPKVKSPKVKAAPAKDKGKTINKDSSIQQLPLGL